MLRRLVAGAAALGLAASVLLVAAPASADSMRSAEYWLSSYGISQAWKTTKGAGVTVAIIDTGVDGSHPDLTGTVIGGTDVSGVGSPNGQTPVGEGSAHATMVASLLAGHGHGSGDGIMGAAPEAKILSVSVGFGQDGSDAQIASAVRWAVDNGASVINMSLTRNTLDWPTSWDDAFLYAMEHDVVVVAAAGNRGSGTTEVGAPATMPGVLVVGGVDRNGVASFDASSQGITIAVCAPSEDLVGAGPGGTYYEWSGTSGATPIIAGIVALVRASHPGLDAGNVINRLTATARGVGTVPNPSYGYGLVNAAAAVTAEVPKVTTNPANQLKDWIKVYRRAASTPAPTEGAATAPAPRREQAAAPANPLGTVLPSIESLRNTGLPLLVYLVFGILAVLLARRFFLNYGRRGGK
ncbi:S8 family serine peptidase [Parafrigoribacterium soli]|uniref:S8 family serine peptidase n=1 Tax=Parafrigoribacterium soli TaxID=3144663 RepID=UPI0032EC1C76